MTAWLFYFHSSHALDSLKDGVRLNSGIEPIGDFYEHTGEKGRVFGSIRYLLVFRPVLSGCSTCAVVFCWPGPFSGFSAGVCCWHLGLMNTNCNFSLLNQQLSANSALAALQTLCHLLCLDQVTPLLVKPLHSVIAGSCHVETKRSLGDHSRLYLPMTPFLRALTILFHHMEA